MTETRSFSHKVKWGIWFPCYLLATLGAAQTIHSEELVIVTQPQSQTNVFIGFTVSFTVDTSGGSGKTYFQWQLNSLNISLSNNATANDRTLVITNVQTRDAGIYRVIIVDNVNVTNSLTANLTITSITNIGGSDLFINATNIPSWSGNVPITNFVFRSDNFNTTPNETGEPRHSGKKGGKSVWYKWAAPFSGILTVSTIGSDFDTLLGVYTGLTVANLTNAVDPETADDDVDGLLASKATLNVASNQTYFIAVDGYGRGEGNIILNFELEPSPEILPIVLLRTTSQVMSLTQLISLSTFFTPTSTADLAEVRWFRDGIDTGITTNILANLRVDKTNVGSYYVRMKTKKGKDIKLRPTILQINNTISNNISFLDTNQFTLDKFFDAIDKSTNGFTLNAAPPPPPGSGLSLESLDPGLETGPASGYTSTQIFSTSSSTKEAGEPNHCGIIGGASEWFSYQAPTTGYSNPYLRINTDGSSYPTILAVYTNAAPGTSFTNLVPIACDSGHATNGNGSGVYFKAVPGALYYVAIDGVNGAKGSAQLNILYGDPVVASGPANQMASVGMTASFVATTSGSGTPTFQWAKNGLRIPGATTYRYDVLNVSPADAGSYSVQVSNLVSMVTNSATLSLSGPPAIITQPSGQTSPAGIDVTMSIQATGSNPLTYQWRVNSANISGATNSALLITNVDSGDAGNYLVVIANSFGSVTSTVAALTVNTPPTITTQPASRSGAAGSSVSLNVTAVGWPSPAYQWQARGTNVPGATGATLTISNFQTLNEGSYLVVVTNSFGSVVSSNASLYVNSPLRLNSSAVAGSAGFSFQLIGVGGSNYIFQASTNLTIWASLLTNNNPNGIVVFTDPASTNFPRRFYRAQPGP